MPARMTADRYLTALAGCAATAGSSAPDCRRRVKLSIPAMKSPNSAAMTIGTNRSDEAISGAARRVAVTVSRLQSRSGVMAPACASLGTRRRSLTRMSTPQASSARPNSARGMPIGRGELITSARWITPAPMAANDSHERVMTDMRTLPCDQSSGWSYAVARARTTLSAPRPTPSRITALPKWSTLSAVLMARMFAAEFRMNRPTIPSSR